MTAERYVTDLVAWIARGADGPPPPLPPRVDAALETRLVRLALAQDLAGILSDSLSRFALDPGLSALARARLSREADALDARTRACRRTIERAERALAAAGVASHAAGDAAAAELMPPGVRRPVLSAEVLVAPDDLARALAALVAAGFRVPASHPVLAGWRGERMSARRLDELRRFSHHVAPLVLAAPDGPPLRLRTHRLDVGPLERVEDTGGDQMGAMSGAGVPRAIDTPRAYDTSCAQDAPGTADPPRAHDAPRAADVVAEAAVRVGIDGFASLLPLVDLARAARLCNDWERVDVLARRARVRDAVRDTVRRACAMLGADDVRRRVPMPRLAGALVRELAWRRARVDWTEPGEWRGRRFRYGVTAIEGLAARLEWIRGHWRVEPRWVRNRLGARPTLLRRVRFRFVAREAPDGGAGVSRWTQAAREPEREGAGTRGAW